MAEKILNHNDVLNVSIIGREVLHVERRQFEPFTTGVVSVSRVEPATLEGFLSESGTLDFVVNLPKESFWTGDAIRCVQAFGIG